jgi:hypothetical protein
MNQVRATAVAPLRIGSGVVPPGCAQVPAP